MENSIRAITFIDIDDLGIDKCNIREGKWDHAEEIVSSIKKGGVRLPLLIRPADPSSGIKYGIVCGSRRYNAAIEAGFTKVPCVIKEMTDLEAMEESMIENRMREDTPTWKDIEYVGEMYEAYLRDESLSYSDAVERITGIGISKPTVEKYIKIFNLPIEIKGLLREPNERTIRQKEYLKQFEWRETNRTLYIGHAALLTELNDVPLKRLMKVALLIWDKSFDVAGRIVYSLKVHPNKNINKIYEEICDKDSMVQRVIRLDGKTNEALEWACMDKQIRWDKLINKIIKYWLKRHKYWGSK